MAKKQATPQPSAPRSASTTTTPAKPPPSTPSTTKQTPSQSTSVTKTAPSTLSPRSSPQEIAIHVWNKYIQETPSRTLFLDIFLLYIALNGAVQFIYCIIGGNYPFNAFLSGFGAAVGQFVLTVSLRMQTVEQSPTETNTGSKTKVVDGVEEKCTGQISSERAFADFVFGSLILHGFCVNFIN
ncbi:Dolichyl-diphosphooligosaccharide--protein glycosyltransferase subunit dad1 [Cyphellophora attinorum]|uniref:Dolichyl-diphosphooligosaccharide--protein glycosyltransferase subunit OST2 n=1 Tax=Cyphellophora attinorum TaxID=1664694 RepID=A0A0N1NXJ8_9EURO|nr:Dolichyl-diphosphooligosaccharide--protein glycosyltransferase subunit dad1 [Phialophora attinorum]KPI38615.1 Dolichyl-diphosphooligosaccharide--protein glycosyltransferase subunit dad1 [Phialophora attinorum]